MRESPRQAIATAARRGGASLLPFATRAGLLDSMAPHRGAAPAAAAEPHGGAMVQRMAEMPLLQGSTERRLGPGSPAPAAPTTPAASPPAPANGPATAAAPPPGPPPDVRGV